MEAIQRYLEIRGISGFINAINDSGRRIVDIMSNMLSFSRKREHQRSFHRLTDLMNKTLELAAIDFNLKKHSDFKKIEIIKEYDENIPNVPCESVAFNRFFLISLEMVLRLCSMQK